MSRGPTLLPLTLAHLACLAAYQAAFALAFIDIRLSAAPLALFLAASFIAPFLPRFSFFLPIISRGRKDLRTVALTFDDGPDPATTPALLDLLAKYAVPATFFVTGLNASAHPDLIRLILSRGHSIGNHSYHHSPLLMLKSGGTLRTEITLAQSILREFDITPLAFRPPVGITNPRLWRVLIESEMCCVNFSCRAFDAGNRRLKGLSKKILGRARPGDIILLHDANPGNGIDAARWIREIENILIGLKKNDLEILPLSNVIGRPVMRHTASQSGGVPNPAEAFYNSIARTYDAERCRTGAGIVSRKEHELFESHLLYLIAPHHRVLEIGAGTGRFTLPLARRCRAITAVELSHNMMAVLKENAARETVSRIEFKTGDIESIDLNGMYDVVCSFSCFEYIPDLEELFKKLTECVKPGGVLYFTTAHRSLFRFFPQVGNAMRQGIWLHARTKRSIYKSLAGTGFAVKQISTHVLKICVSGGMLLEVMAFKDAGKH